MRYIGTITSATDFRINDFTSILVAVTNGSTSAIALFQSVKIRRVGITCLPASATNAGTFGFTWRGDRGPQTVETMIYAPGNTEKWNFYPPEDSMASLWIDQDSSAIDTSSIFELDPDNSIVKIVLDLQFDYVIASGASDTVNLSGAASLTGIAAVIMPGSATDELLPVDIFSVQR